MTTEPTTRDEYPPVAVAYTAPVQVEPQPEPAVPAAVALEAEVEQLPDGYVRVPLGETETVRTLVPSRWRASHLRCLHQGNLDAMAVGTDDDPSGKFRPGILHEDDVEVWYDVDPTQEEIDNWFRALTDAGESVKKSSGRGRSTRSTPRR